MFTKIYESDFSEKSLKELSDFWLDVFFQYAIELQCGKYLKAVKTEINRRYHNV